MKPPSNGRIRITRRLEFDAGHRIPDHGSQCRNLHGHRYAIEVTVDGPVIDRPGASNHGMVLDFSDIKTLIRETIVDRWDHAFLAWRHDTVVVDFLNALPNHKTVLLDCVPTAENLAQQAFTELSAAFAQRFGDAIQLTQVRLYETPNCWSDASQ